MSNEELFKKFEQLRADRWNNLNALFDTDEYDNLLADVANIVTVIWARRQIDKQLGFKPYGTLDD